MRRMLSIEVKMILSAVFFTLLIVGLERYQFSENIVEQFIESKKSKNRLLVDTVSPILGLNLSLGLDEANREYLDQIARQNGDLIRFELIDPQGIALYTYSRDPSEEVRETPGDLHFCSQPLSDPLTGEKLATMNLYFDDHEYQNILKENRKTTLKIFAVTLLILSLFVLLIKREFTFLKKLTENVLKYDPKLNNFNLPPTSRNDEVGIIHNAILSMVERIQTHARALDEINQSLEEKISERTRELEAANRQLKELSITDPLTQLFNRRHFQHHMQELWQLANRNRVDISLIMCDIDHFKEVNDTYGHLMGDAVLKEIAVILKASVKRSTDFIARYGGEEFVIVLYDTDINTAENLCVTIQKNIRVSEGFTYDGVNIPPVTLSFGIGCLIPDESNRYEDLIQIADTHLYQAKQRGRNCIVTGNRPSES